MSTKELLERLSRSGGTPTVARPQRPTTPEVVPDTNVSRTRVGNVIRKRRVDEPQTDTPAGPEREAGRSPTLARPAGAEREAGRSPTHARPAGGEREAGRSPSLAKEPAPPPAAEASVRERPRPEPEPAAAPTRKKAATPAQPADPHPAVASSASSESHAEEAPAPPPPPTAPPPKATTRKTSRKAAAATAAAKEEEEKEGKVAPPPVETAPPAPPEPVVPPKPAPLEPTPPEPPSEPALRVALAPSATGEPGDSAGRLAAPRQVDHSAFASELPRVEPLKRPDPPRLSAADREDPLMPGLGKAVIRPPPGYDPNDPSGNRRRAQAAAQASVRDPNAPRTWRDESTTPAAPGAAEERPANRKRRSAFVERFMDEIPAARRRRRTKNKAAPTPPVQQAKAIKRRIEVDGRITVANLAHAMSVKSSQVIKSLMGMGQMVTANDPLDLDTAQIVAAEFNHEVVNAEFREESHLIDVVENTEGQINRPPVVTVMGHVDHGKTTLLDAIRKTHVAAGEAGGITQHIGAYQVERSGRLVTFLDTPGHEAFTAMRARGAQATDIVVLVVAADDGVMPQTLEALSHAKAAGVQILVAVNKCDKADANPGRVRQALMEHGLVPEDFGGDTVFVEVSALKGKGIDTLIENILLVADVAELTANPTRHAEGVVLEARIERGRGPVATLLVKQGTLKQGDSIVLGTTWGRVRAMADYSGRSVREAPPSMPIEVIGLEEVPVAGDDFVVVEADKDAKTLADHRAAKARQAAMNQPQRATLEDLIAKGQNDALLELKLVVKSDVGGTLEAIKQALGKIEVSGTSLKTLHAGVGAITENDVSLAQAYGAVVIGFNVRPDANARKAAERMGIEIRTYSVIYEMLDEIQKAMRGLLGPTTAEKVQGTAELRQTFTIRGLGTIAGCMVTEGKVARNHLVRLLRDGVVVWTGRLGSLKRFKDDVREVENGYECGMSLDGYNDIKIGDVVEAYTVEEVTA